MICEHEGCGKPAEDGSDECFRHRVLGVGVTFKGGVMPGRSGWNRDKSEYMREHYGTTSEKELASRGIVRADKV